MTKIIALIYLSSFIIHSTYSLPTQTTSSQTTQTTSSPDVPNLTLYSDIDQQGLEYSTTGDRHDLEEYNFNDATRSICGLGLWFLYERKDYDKKSDFVHSFAHENYFCENLDDTQFDQVSSVRFAGLEDIYADSLTLYQFETFTGAEYLVERDIDWLGDYDDRTSSLVVTGSSSWTLYEDPGYSGGSACVIPKNVDDWYYGLFELDELGFPNNEVSSIQKGCHSKRVFKAI